VIVGLDNGLELAFPPRLAQGLEHATPADLAIIEISPLGTACTGPRSTRICMCRAATGRVRIQELDGSPSRRRRGSARSDAKVAAARENGRKGGRPRKLASA